MKFEHTRTYGWESALRGMRNPKNSWHLSDSEFGYDLVEEFEGGRDKSYVKTHEKDGIVEWIKIGPKDMDLALRLRRAGSVHRKFLRQIFISVDITAPNYFFREFDTYKIGTVANSTSTMHKLASTPITKECFEMDDFQDFNFDTYCRGTGKQWELDIAYLESLRQAYNETKDKRIWKELIRRLPDSWLYTRTVTLNYEVLVGMMLKDARRNHKLNEWSGIDDPTKENFVKWVRSLPYAQELIFTDELKIEEGV